MLIRLICALSILVMICVLPGPLLAQAPDAVTITVTDFGGTLAAITGQPRFFGTVTWTPDLTHLAYWSETSALCIATIATHASTCYPLPPGSEVAAWTPMTWSLAQDAVLFVADDVSDNNRRAVWSFDREAETYTNITINQHDADHRIEYKVWAGPDNILLAEHKLVFQDDRWQSTVTLYRYDRAAATRETLLDLGTDPFDFYDLRVAVSPDGQRLALIRHQAAGDYAMWGLTNRLALFDLTTNTLSDVATVADLMVGLPENYQEQFGFTADDVIWTPDGSALIVQLEGGKPFVPVGTLATRIDLATGTITPVVDLSEVTEEQYTMSWFNLPGEGEVTPDGRYFFYETVNDDGVRLWAAPTESDDQAPIAVPGEVRLQCGQNYPLFTVRESDHSAQYLLLFSIGCGE